MFGSRRDRRDRAVGHHVSLQHAPAATVAPLEYSGLAWVLVIDWLGWATIPGWRMLAGAAVIIASGVYLVRHESRRA
jgi:drug/metabolite transporter (DMT)-like permease